MFRVFIGLLLVGVLNGHPLSPESDGISTPRNVVEDEVTLALDLLPPKIDAEDTNFEVATLSTDLLPPKEDENTTLSTDLLPPGEDEESHNHGVVFVINLYALSNETTNTTDLLNDDIKEKVPGIIEPYATILLVVEDDNETIPVNLNELAKDLEEEGVFVEKYGEDIDDRVIRIDFDADSPNEDPDIDVLHSNKMSKVRRRRSPHLLKKLKQMRMKGGGGCNVCQQAPPPCMTCGQPPPCMTCGPPPPPPCGGGCGPPPPPPPPPCMMGCGGPPPQQHSLEIVPIIIRWEERPAPQQQMGSCNVCGGNQGHQGYHGSYSQASAQASAHSW